MLDHSYNAPSFFVTLTLHCIGSVLPPAIYIAVARVLAVSHLFTVPLQRSKYLLSKSKHSARLY